MVAATKIASTLDLELTIALVMQAIHHRVQLAVRSITVRPSMVVVIKIAFTPDRVLIHVHAIQAILPQVLLAS